MRRHVILTRLGGRSREPGQAQLASRLWARAADSNFLFFLKERAMRSISIHTASSHGSPQKLLGVLAIAFLAATAAGAAGPTLLAPLSGDIEAEALGVSDSGESVGVTADFTSYPYDWGYSPVLWDRQGNPSELPLPAECPEQFPFPRALGAAESINNQGAAVGNCYLEGFVLTGLRWDKNGNPSLLGIPAGDVGTIALNINEKGHAAGYSYGATLTALVWDATGTPRALPPLPGDTPALARDLNNNGLVAGKSGQGNVGSGIETAVVWDQNGNPTALSPLPGDEDSSGWRINERGEVLGVSYTDFGVRTPVKWDANGNVTVLGPPVDSLVRAINDQGQAGGWLGGSTTPTLWSADGTATSLPVLDGDAAGHVHGLNNRGQAVGGSFGEISSAVLWDTKGTAAAASVAISVDTDAALDRPLTRRERRALKKAQRKALRKAERWQRENRGSPPLLLKRRDLARR